MGTTYLLFLPIIESGNMLNKKERKHIATTTKTKNSQTLNNLRNHEKQFQINQFCYSTC
jgi:hypothetical protein